MAHLNIQQGSAIEVVPEKIVKKLYDVALEIPEPQEGETDAAYMSGHISVTQTYQQYVEYLAGTIGEGDNGVITSTRQNAAGRFQDLTIDVTNGYYIPFEDANMLSYLLNLGIGSNGAITTVQAAAVTSISGETNTTITKFNELKYFTNITKIYKPENGIAPAFFRNWTALEEIDLTNITQIGNRYNAEGGLNGCTSLKTVNNAGNVSLLVNAFSGCINLENIYGLTGVLTVGYESFKNCKKLSNATFQNCQILLDSGIRHGSEFSGCKNITTITLHPNSTAIDNWGFETCSNLTTVNNFENIGYIGTQAFTDCSNLVLNSSDFANVTTIKGRAFRGCTSLNIELTAPKLITLQGESFYNAPITKIKCLGKIQEIGGNSFRKDRNSNILTEVYLPYECTTIGSAAFSKNTGLTTIKQYVDSIDNWVEGQTPQYTNISRITSFGSECFNGCTSLSLTNADITNAISIGSNVFGGVTLTGDIHLPNITSLGNAAFANSTITSIDLTGSTITNIPQNCFANCSNLNSVTLSSSITSLESLSFDNCTALNNIILPNIQTVGQLSFRRRDNQQNRVIDCGSNLTSWSGDQFGNNAKVTLILRGSSIPNMVDNFYNSGYWDTTIYVPRDMIAVYKADTDGWGRIQGRDGREVFYALEDSIYANTNWYQQQ